MSEDPREAIQTYCQSFCRKRVAATVADCEHRKCQLWEFRGNGQTPAQQGFSVGEWVHIESWGGSSFKIGSFNDKDFSEPHAHVKAGATGVWVPVSKLRKVE